MNSLCDKIGSILRTIQFVDFHEDTSPKHIAANSISSKAILRRNRESPLVICACSKNCVSTNICKSHRFRIFEVVLIRKYIIYKSFFICVQLLPDAHRCNFNGILSAYTVFSSCNNNCFTFGLSFYFTFVVNNCNRFIRGCPSNAVVAGIFRKQSIFIYIISGLVRNLNTVSCKNNLLNRNSRRVKGI